MMLNLDPTENEDNKTNNMITKYGSLQAFVDSYDDIAENYSEDLFSDEY